ncbi:IS3 family transposase [uncultured Flavonifractor sp.]|uniref:IS3 family transposase n=1 Tax=uncultured Flavonifractor sp. TaxID=1193534 RepID=UPI002596EB58|nr:IS3 family transposase [uncultured Flavonifractor sp.]
MPKQYSPEFKSQVVLAVQKGLPIKTASQRYQIVQTTIYRWMKECGQADVDFSITDYTTLQRKNQQLEHILQIIRLSGIIEEVPLQKRLVILARLHEQFEQYSVHELCEALNVSRGTFYNHIFRKADCTKYLEEQQALMLQVQQIFDDSKQRYGAEKIRIVLAENGIRVGKERIRKIMNELGLVSIRENAKSNYKKRQQYQKRNLLNQEFKAKRKNEIWVSDITYFKIKDYAVYLCVIIDLFSRRVVGYRVSKKSSTHLVTATFKKAFEDRGQPANLTFHSDRGGQYMSDTFMELLRSCGVKQSFSNSGRPYDNAVAETFFSTFKKEEAYRRDYSSEADFRKSVDEYIRFYNEVRPHQTLAYKSPARFEELYGKETTQDT